MIPITEYTVTAVAALIYNDAYDQDPDTGWIADDEHSALAHESCWVEWSSQLLHILREHPDASDEQVFVLAKQRVDTHKVGTGWDIIPMDQDSDSTISHETSILLPIIRHFLEQPNTYIESSFLEGISLSCLLRGSHREVR